jgi:hypothetical protein
MIHEVKGIPFQYICEIIPELDADGIPIEYMPQSRYKNSTNIPLHEYGYGPFCRFKIPNKYNGKMGVYITLVDSDIKYVGECEDLGTRFNMGYGNISPRNCYVGGQPTNCRINSLILEMYKRGSQIELLFYETRDRFNIERTLINELNPEWNRTAGKASRPRGHQKGLSGKKSLDLEKRRVSMSKYYKLEEYLRNTQKQVETLSYDEIERILGFRLPSSAYNHRPWWANGGHSQANSWLNAGWEVSSVELGKSVTFRKVEKAKTTEEYRSIPKEIPSGTKPISRIEDIPKLIKELYQLKTEGIITEEEFEEKKRHLLSKL